MITGREFESAGIDFAFYLFDDDGAPICPTEEQTRAILNLKFAREVSAQGASGYVVVFHVDNIRFNHHLIGECKRKVAEVLCASM